MSAAATEEPTDEPAAAEAVSADVDDPDAQPLASTWSFTEWAAERGISLFAKLVVDTGLHAFIENSEAALTLFSPTDEAIRELGNQLPTDTQLLRELLCVHITMGSLRSERPEPAA